MPLLPANFFLRSSFIMNTNRRTSRRAFLRGAGVTLTLPLLEAMALPRARAASSAPPRRMICINATLGLHTPNLFPARVGATSN